MDVLSFKRLAYRVFEDLGVQVPAVLDDMGKSMVLRKVAGMVRRDLGLYGSHLEQPGFISQLNHRFRAGPVRHPPGGFKTGRGRNGSSSFKGQA